MELCPIVHNFSFTFTDTKNKKIFFFNTQFLKNRYILCIMTRLFKKQIYIIYYNPALSRKATGEKNSKLHFCLIVNRVCSGEVAQVILGETKRTRKSKMLQNVAATNKYWWKMPKRSSNSVTEQARCPTIQVAAGSTFL